MASTWIPSSDHQELPQELGLIYVEPMLTTLVSIIITLPHSVYQLETPQQTLPLLSLKLPNSLNQTLLMLLCKDSHLPIIYNQLVLPMTVISSGDLTPHKDPSLLPLASTPVTEVSLTA